METREDKRWNRAYKIYNYIDENQSITSLTLAKYLGVTHKSVKQAIEKLGCSDEFKQGNFHASTWQKNYYSHTKKLINQRCYYIEPKGLVYLMYNLKGSVPEYFTHHIFDLFTSYVPYDPRTNVFKDNCYRDDDECFG